VLHGLKSILNIEHLEVLGQELEELVLDDFLDGLFGRFTTTGSSIRRLSIDKGGDHSSRLVERGGKISVGVKSEHQWVILGRHGIDEGKVTGMIGEVRNGVVVVKRLLVENEVSTEDVFTDEEVSVGEEQSSIFFLSNLSSVLDGAAHLLHGFPLVLTVLE
jgi:hypothetical protein